MKRRNKKVRIIAGSIILSVMLLILIISFRIILWIRRNYYIIMRVITMLEDDRIIDKRIILYPGLVMVAIIAIGITLFIADK